MELKIIRLEDSVTADEVTDNIAGIGGCQFDIRTGDVRTSTQSLNTLWIKYPLVAARKVIRGNQASKIKLRWTWARIEMLQNRPL